MTKSSKKSSSSKPQKPSRDFSLFPHHTGRCAKKVRGKLRYFGKVKGDPKGRKALAKWLEQKDDLLAGRTPRTQSDGLTIRDLCNRFLTTKQNQLNCQKITPRTFLEYKRVCARIISVFGLTRLVSDLTPYERKNRHRPSASRLALVAAGLLSHACQGRWLSL